MEVDRVVADGQALDDGLEARCVLEGLWVRDHVLQRWDGVEGAQLGGHGEVEVDGGVEAADVDEDSEETRGERDLRVEQQLVAQDLGGLGGRRETQHVQLREGELVVVEEAARVVVRVVHVAGGGGVLRAWALVTLGLFTAVDRAGVHRGDQRVEEVALEDVGEEGTGVGEQRLEEVELDVAAGEVVAVWLLEVAGVAHGGCNGRCDAHAGGAGAGVVAGQWRPLSLCLAGGVAGSCSCSWVVVAVAVAVVQLDGCCSCCSCCSCRGVCLRLLRPLRGGLLEHVVDGVVHSAGHVCVY